MSNVVPCLQSHRKAKLLQKIAQRMPDLDLETIQIVTQIQSLARAFSGLLSSDMETYGLTEGKFYVLCHLQSEKLFEHDDPAPSEIADAVGVTRATITGLLDGLERDGYIERRHDVQDRRGLTIKMTDKAAEFMDNFAPECMLSLAKEIALDKRQKLDCIQYLSKVEAAVEIVLHTNTESEPSAKP